MNYFLNELIKEFHLPLQNNVLIFSLVLFIILLSPILLRRLNIPSIIGLIISGVVIGPYGFNILEKTSAIELFSTIGLLYIMFIAGLELDLNRFKANRNKSLVFGGLTFIFPLAIGFPVCYYFLEYDADASFLTASMFATHTLVAYPIVSRLGISKNQAVAVSVGGTILTDTAVLILLAVVIGSHNGELNQEFWIRLLVSLALFSFIMFLIIPRIAVWFFRKLEREKHSHYIFVLFVVFFAAFLAEVAGVEPIIGAFIAGLSLNRLIPHSSALMNRVEFIGNSLFIPFFLLSVGMLVDISVLLKGPTALIVAGTLTVVALFGKWIAAFITQKLFNFSKAQRQLIFGLSSAHAAATLAVILVGYKANILDENILNGTIILILITCIVASFSAEKAAKKILIEQDEMPMELDINEMLNQEHIMLPLASGVNIENLLEFGIFIKDKKSVTPISILTVVNNSNEVEENILKARVQLEEIAKFASGSDTKLNLITSIDLNEPGGIIRTAKEIMADIILLNWPKKQNLMDKIIGEEVNMIVASVSKMIFVCHFDKPLIAHNRMVILVPALAELEEGFSIWMHKITSLALELSVSIVLKCNEISGKSVNQFLSKAKIKATLEDRPDDLSGEFLPLRIPLSKTDLLVIISSRKGAISYTNAHDNLATKLEKNYPENSRIIVYPNQYNYNYQSVSIDNYAEEAI